MRKENLAINSVQELKINGNYFGSISEMFWVHNEANIAMSHMNLGVSQCIYVMFTLYYSLKCAIVLV